MNLESPFYLGANRRENAKLWYKGQPMGETKLNSLMKCAIKKTNIDNNNKKSFCLLDEGIALTSVQQQSGQKHISSLYNYSKNSLKKQNSISNILNRTTLVSDMSSNSKPSSSNAAISTTDNTENDINTVPSTSKCNNTNVMDLNNRQQMPSAMTGMNCADVFPKRTITQGGTFNFNFNMSSETGTGKKNVVPRKKRKFVIDSDSDYITV